MYKAANSQLQKREYLIIENDECKGPIVLEGEVLVSKENAAGERVILSKLGVGELFGEIFAFSGTSIWYASVSAVTDCTVMFLSAARMTGNCANQCINHKQLIQNMLHIVAGKALDLNKRVDYLTIKSMIQDQYVSLENMNKHSKHTSLRP